MIDSFDFDFGFSAMNEDELEAVQKLEAEKQEVTSAASLTASEKEALENKINTLYNMFQPLLNNLAANPEKDYIYWPNRLIKIEAFRDKLDTVYTS